MALVGPSGSGKTYTALTIARHLGKRIALIDTERGSASVYAGEFNFDTLQLTSFSPDKYLEGIQAASEYDVLIIDSLSHAWSGKDGILEFVDKVAARSRSNNSFGAWREATPQHNKLVDGILDATPHVIVTMRAKTEYVQEKNERTGKTEVRKVGMQPVQRDGLEYEMDLVADLDWSNTLVVSKTRCKPLQGYVAKPAGEEFASIVRDWLDAGAPSEEPTKAKPTPAKAEPKGEALNLQAQNGKPENITRPQIEVFAKIAKDTGIDSDAMKMVAESVFDRELPNGIKSLTFDEAAELTSWDNDKWLVAADSYRIPA